MLKLVISPEHDLVSEKYQRIKSVIQSGREFVWFWVNQDTHEYISETSCDSSVTPDGLLPSPTLMLNSNSSSARCGKFDGGHATLHAGELFGFDTFQDAGNVHRVSLSNLDLFDMLEVGSILVAGNEQFKFQVQYKKNELVECDLRKINIGILDLSRFDSASLNGLITVKENNYGV